jgi:hypothetical protein
MPTIETNERVAVTLSLPRPLVDRADELAKLRHSTIETQLEKLLETGLQAETSVRSRLEALSEAYRADLAKAGKLHMTAEEVNAELRRIREQIADELHPE